MLYAQNMYVYAIQSVRNTLNTEMPYEKNLHECIVLSGGFGLYRCTPKKDGGDKEDRLLCYNFILSVKSYCFPCLIEQPP